MDIDGKSRKSSTSLCCPRLWVLLFPFFFQCTDDQTPLIHFRLISHHPDCYIHLFLHATLPHVLSLPTPPPPTPQHVLRLHRRAHRPIQGPRRPTSHRPHPLYRHGLFSHARDILHCADGIPSSSSPSVDGSKFTRNDQPWGSLPLVARHGLACQYVSVGGRGSV